MSGRTAAPIYAFDVDGVIFFDDDGPPWHEAVEARHRLPRGTLADRLFAPHWRQIVTGALPLRPALEAALAGTGATAQAVMDAWFGAARQLSPVMLALMDQLRASGSRVVLATNQEPERMAHLWEVLGLSAHADAAYASAALGAAKPDPAFYAAIEAAEGAAPARFTFIDDRAENVAAARARGWQAHHFTGAAALALALG